jgi:hypothetical protein
MGGGSDANPFNQASFNPFQGVSWNKPFGGSALSESSLGSAAGEGLGNVGRGFQAVGEGNLPAMGAAISPMVSGDPLLGSITGAIGLGAAGKQGNIEDQAARDTQARKSQEAQQRWAQLMQRRRDMRQEEANNFTRDFTGGQDMLAGANANAQRPYRGRRVNFMGGEGA